MIHLCSVAVVTGKLSNVYIYNINFKSMGHIHCSHIRDIFVLSPCAVGFALHYDHDIYFLQMALGVFGVIVAR